MYPRTARQFLIFTLFGLIAIASPNLLSDEPHHFPADVTHGNIRCVLLSVGQSIVFPNKQDTTIKGRTWSDGGCGVKCLTVTYLVECIDTNPPRQFYAGNLEFLTANKPLKIEGHGSYRKVFAYKAFQNFLDFTLPKVSDPQRAIIMQDVRFGVIPDPQPFDIVIEAGFGTEVERFSFNSIRLQ
jgi:hypothetical protein